MSSCSKIASLISNFGAISNSPVWGKGGNKVSSSLLLPLSLRKPISSCKLGVDSERLVADLSISCSISKLSCRSILDEDEDEDEILPNTRGEERSIWVSSSSFASSSLILCKCVVTVVELDVGVALLGIVGRVVLLYAVALLEPEFLYLGGELSWWSIPSIVNFFISFFYFFFFFYISSIKGNDLVLTSEYMSKDFRDVLKKM